MIDGVLQEGVFISMAVYSAGNSYGIDGDLMFSFPVTVKDKQWKIVDVRFFLLGIEPISLRFLLYSFWALNFLG